LSLAGKDETKDELEVS